LHRAARLGDHPEIEALVRAGANVDELFDIQLDPGARRAAASPLMVAAGSADGGSAATVLQLLELGASANPGPGLSPLAYACAGLGWNYPPGGDADRVAVLLAAGADPAATLPNGASALACAARSGDPERVRLLLDAGADPTPDCIVERAGYAVLLPFLDPLFMAAASGSAACVRLLLDSGANPRRYPDEEEHPLSASGSLAVLEILLAAGADPRHEEGGRRTVVESVARNTAVAVEERVRMLQALRAAGADLDHCPEWATPLFSAAMSGEDDSVEALLLAGADPFYEPTGLQAVCFSAISGPHPGVDRVIALLVAAGLDPDQPDEHGLRPLHAALAPDAFGPGYAESDGFNEPAALALIRAGVTLDIQYPETGLRPLHAAAAADCTSVLLALLHAGASPTETTADGRTPLDVARDSGALACVDLLKQAVAPGS
jgi:ankyrin repeat protein